MPKKVLLAMSGGVDSSLAVHLLQKEGYEVVGVTMQLLENGAESDIDDARKVAEKMGIEHYVLERTAEFREKVMLPFAKSYANGKTPNPCVECNRCFKFSLLFDEMKRLGCDYLATGHYARIVENNGVYELHMGLDQRKDQSYVLYHLNQEKLSHILFPLGNYTKEEIRRMAEEIDLPVAEKKDSQDICFVPDGEYAPIVEGLLGSAFPEGDYLDTEGNKMGRHHGIVHYTIGQHKNLGLSLPYTRYVCAIDAVNNTVTLGGQADLMKTEIQLENLHWILPDMAFPVACEAKIRYRKNAEPCLVTENAVRFENPQRAVTPGQSCVFYRGDRLLGGGIIK